MDDVLLAIRTLLLAGLDMVDTYKAVYYGRNTVPATSEMPFVEVIPIGTDMENRGSNSMNNEFEIMVRMQDTLKENITENTNKSIISHSQTFVKRMEERDANGKPLATTILGVLHDNRKLSNTVTINNFGRINYNEEFLDGSWIITAEMIMLTQKITLRS